MEYLGRVHNGRIDLDEKIDLPEGAQVIVSILGDNEQPVDQGITGAELLAAPFIGAWADRDDIGDTATFADELRRKESVR